LYAAVADFNGDGNPDIAAVLLEGNSALLYGNGDGTFQAAFPTKITGGGGYSLAAGDFDGSQPPGLVIPVTLDAKIVVISRRRTAALRIRC
jgi:hypothetical protein